MNSIIILILFGGMTMFTAGCNHKTNAPLPTEENFQEIYTAKIGEITIANFNSGELPGEGLIIQIDSVLEDSRCPEGATCIWEGNGKVQITIQAKNSEPKTIELNTTLKPQVEFYENYAITLVALAPYPKLNHPIKQEDYQITLAVYKRDRDQ